MADWRDVALEFFREERTQSRHHEVLREKAAALAVAFSGALVAFITRSGFPSRREDLAACAILLAVGIFGGLWSHKHYERSRRHARLARAYRGILAKWAGAQEQDLPPFGDLRDRASQAHEARFPKSSSWRLYRMWIYLHAFLGLVAVGLAAIIVLHLARAT